jgi:hypothetical protein
MKFQIKSTINRTKVMTCRLGSGLDSTGGAGMRDADRLKFIKLVAESRYDLCAAGDDIEGWVSSVDTATSDGYTTGGRASGGLVDVCFDGVQATPGTGTVALGDYLVCGTVVAKQTALTTSFPKVCSATSQSTAKTSPYAFRVVSLGSAGTGAVGTFGVAEHVTQG